MKTVRHIFAVMLILAMTAMATGCGKEPLNNKLDHQWQVMKIEYPDGRVDHPEKLYYCIYREVVELSRGRIVAAGIIRQEGSMLTMTFPYSTAAELEPWGLTVADGEPTDVAGPQFSLDILRLTGSELVMVSSQDVKIHCRQF